MFFCFLLNNNLQTLHTFLGIICSLATSSTFFNCKFENYTMMLTVTNMFCVVVAGSLEFDTAPTNEYFNHSRFLSLKTKTTPPILPIFATLPLPCPHYIFQAGHPANIYCRVSAIQPESVRYGLRMNVLQSYLFTIAPRFVKYFQIGISHKFTP